MNKLGISLLCASAMCVTAAVLAEPLHPVYLAKYGGTYAENCDDAYGERLAILEDRLTFTDGELESVAKDILPSLSYWGRMPPEGFEIALLAGEAPGTSLMFLIYYDDEGLFILLDGRADDPSNDETRFRKCES